MNSELHSAHLKLSPPVGGVRPDEILVRELERVIGSSLPEGFRSFLLQYGGCDVEFSAPLSEVSPYGRTFCQTRFLGLGEDPDRPSDIRFYLESLIVPRNMIVIASGDFGQATTLSFAGVDRGSVFFLDENQMAFADESHMHYQQFASVREFIRLRDAGELGAKPAGYDHCYRSASSFSEFLSQCRLIED